LAFLLLRLRGRESSKIWNVPLILRLETRKLLWQSARWPGFFGSKNVFSFPPKVQEGHRVFRAICWALVGLVLGFLFGYKGVILWVFGWATYVYFLVYLEALCAFFYIYNITYQKKKKKKKNYSKVTAYDRTKHSYHLCDNKMLTG
jgi:hypothetical protein